MGLEQFKINEKLFKKDLKRGTKEWNSLSDKQKKICTFGDINKEKLIRLQVISSHMADFVFSKENIKKMKENDGLCIAKDITAQLCEDLTDNTMEAIFLYAAFVAKTNDRQRELQKNSLKELINKLLD